MAQSSPQVERRVRDVPLSAVVGANIHARRVTRLPKMSQQELAEAAGVNINTIGLIEAGRDPERRQMAIRIDTIEAIAKALGCEAYELLAWSEYTRVYLQARTAWSPTLVRGGRPPASRTTTANPSDGRPDGRHLRVAPIALHN